MTDDLHDHDHSECDFHDANGVAGWRVQRATKEFDDRADHVYLDSELRLIRQSGWLAGPLDATRIRRMACTDMLGQILTPAPDELARAREQGDHTLLEQAHAAARLTDRLPQPLHIAADTMHMQFHVQEQTERTLARRLWDLNRQAAKTARAKTQPDTGTQSRGRGLSDRQQQILAVIRESVASRGYPPSVREIGEAIGVKSTNAVHGHLGRLEKKGFIRRDGSKPRAIVANADRQPPSPSSQQANRQAEQVAKQRAETRAQLQAVRGIQRDLRAAGAAITQRTRQLRDLDQTHHRAVSRGLAALKILAERGHPVEHQVNGIPVHGVLDTKTGTIRTGPWDTVIAQPSRDEEAPHTLGGTGTVQALAAENARTRDGRPDVARREQAVRDRAQLTELARQLDPDPAPTPAARVARQRPSRARQRAQPRHDRSNPAGQPDGRQRHGDRERGEPRRGRRSRDDGGRER